MAAGLDFAQENQRGKEISQILVYLLRTLLKMSTFEDCVISVLVANVSFIVLLFVAAVT